MHLEYPYSHCVSKMETYDDEEARQYVCRNCHTVLVTDNHTALNTCLFCGNPMRPGERMSGDLAPTKIIPFRISKKDATHRFHKWKHNLIFAPKEYGKNKKKKDLIGLYVPFWLYDIQTKQEASLHAMNEKTLKENKEKVIQTSHYELYRQTDLQFQNIPESASEMFSQNILQKIMPYDFSALRNFSLRDLSDHYAEQYQISEKDCRQNAADYANQLTNQFLLQTAKKYQKVSLTQKEGDTTLVTTHYALLPVWVVRYDYRDKEYTFLMNGQTGKIAGNAPLSPVKLAIGFGLAATFTFMFCRVLTVLLGGPLL